MNFLDQLIAGRRAAVARSKADVPIAAHREVALARVDPRDFEAALRAARAVRPPAVIAEFKRRSPSGGDIDATADPATVAQAYELGGAAAISVLTEPALFGGSFADLAAARSACGLPVLCKDFIIDAYQVWEAAARGADAILLIAAILDDVLLRGLFALASALRLTPLVEIHDAAGAQRAIALGAHVVGVNNRDLRTFAVDVGNAIRVAASMPSECLVIGESGYRTAADLAACTVSGIGAVLVGETLMREADKAHAVRRLRGDV